MKKNTLAVAVLSLIAITACDPEAKDTTTSWPLPDGLKDCKVYSLISSDASTMTVVRCPATPTSNASTTTEYKSGKTTKYITVVEQPCRDKDGNQPEAPELPK